MIGGYMSYQGIEGKARYKDTPIEEILPVTMFPGDDRMEIPEGFVTEAVKPQHPVLDQIPSQEKDRLSIAGKRCPEISVP